MSLKLMVPTTNPGYGYGNQDTPSYESDPTSHVHVTFYLLCAVLSGSWRGMGWVIIVYKLQSEMGGSHDLAHSIVRNEKTIGYG